MANISKPVDINKIWSASEDILAPSDTKISQGWAVEIPPRQYFNYIDNKQDQAIAHINQHGIPVWDSQTEYQAGTSYTQGSDGNIYKCLITATNVNPVGDSTGTWQTAFLTASSATQVATAAQARALTANNVFMSPLQVANAFTGSNQSLGGNGFQRLPGGLLLQWGVASSTSDTAPGTVNTFPTAFSTGVFAIVGANDTATSVGTISFTPINTTTFYARSSAVPDTFFYLAIGF